MQSKGFTLVEFLIVMTVMAVGFTIGIANLFKSQAQAESKAARADFLAVLELARSKALNNEVLNDSCPPIVGYSVEWVKPNLKLAFECSNTVLVKSFSFSKYKQTIISSPTGTSKVTFHRLGGAVDQRSVFCLYNTSRGKYTRIVISKSGIITYQDNEDNCAS